MSSIPLALEGSSNDSASKTSESEMETECEELAWNAYISAETYMGVSCLKRFAVLLSDDGKSTRTPICAKDNVTYETG